MELTQENLDKVNAQPQSRLHRKQRLRLLLISLGAGSLYPLVREMTDEQISAMEMLAWSGDILLPEEYFTKKSRDRKARQTPESM